MHGNNFKYVFKEIAFPRCDIYIYLAKVVLRLVHISNIETPGNIV